MKAIIKYQDKILKMLAGKVEGFYLGGGTALSKVYFHHRESFDLDFFTKRFDGHKISETIKELSRKIAKEIELAGEENRKNFVKIRIYYVILGKKASLKIDFIEDWLNLIKPLKKMDGISVLSLEDIYIRKIYTVTGTIEIDDSIGRKILRGGRSEAKDLYDLYFLSHTFMGLSSFASKYCDSTKREALIRWFRTYDRMDIKTALLELKTEKRIDYKNMEVHLKKEIEKLIEKEIDVL